MPAQLYSLNTPHAATTFRLTRTSSALIATIRELSNGTSVSAKNQSALREDRNKSVKLEHTDALRFDRELWALISKMQIEVPWENYVSGVTKAQSLRDELVKSPPTVSVSSDLIDSLREAVSAEETLHNELQERYPGVLQKIAEVCICLPKSPDFDRLIECGAELSQLLSSLAGKPGNDDARSARTNIPYLRGETWDWLFPAILSCYSSFISAAEDKTGEDLGLSGYSEGHTGYGREFDSVRAAAIETRCFYSGLFLSLLAVHSITTLDSFKRPLLELISTFRHISLDGVFLNVLRTLLENSYSSAKAKGKMRQESLKDERKQYANVYTEIATSIIDGSRGQECITSKAFDSLLTFYLSDDASLVCSCDANRESWADIEAFRETWIEKPLESICGNLRQNSVPTEREHTQATKLYGGVPRSIVDSEVRAWFKERSSGAPSIDAVARFIESISWISGLDSAKVAKFEPVAQWFVQRLVSLQVQSGDIQYAHLPNLEYVHAYSCFYEHISTIAIVLASDFPEEESLGSHSVTERYVTAATAICEAGFVDYAVALMSFGLMRLHLGLTRYDRLPEPFALCLLDSFVRKSDVWKRAEHLLIPTLRVIEQDSQYLPVSHRLWIRSIVGQFKAGNVYLMPKPTVDDRAREASPPPPWVVGSDVARLAFERVDRAVRDLQPGIHLSAEEWRKLCVSQQVGPNLYELCKVVEQAVKQSFQALHATWINSASLQDGFDKLGRVPLRCDLDSQVLQLGWIDQVVSRVCKCRSRAAVEHVVTLSGERDVSLGQLLSSVRSLPPDECAAFGRFVQLRNGLAHTTRIIARDDAVWLFGYVSDRCANVIGLHAEQT